MKRVHSQVLTRIERSPLATGRQIDYTSAMSPLLVALTFLTGPSVIGHKIDIGVIPLEQAVALNRKRVRATFVITHPPDTHGDKTILGTGFDDIERTAFVPKNLLLDKGDEVTVFGKLEVIHHPLAVVNGQFVKAWHEIRIETPIVQKRNK